MTRIKVMNRDKTKWRSICITTCFSEKGKKQTKNIRWFQKRNRA